VSLTTVAEPEEIVQRHFGESFFAVRAVPLEAGRLADIGSGAGFPGAAIAILCPSIHTTLIESNSRKAAFLETLRVELGLKNLDVANVRAEDAQAILAACDFVTARALGQYRELLRALRNRVQSKAKVILWLGAYDAAELRALRGWDWKPEVKIPQSQRRVLLIGSSA
jgi:16S rRNA (guanine527-N7)-methyltransferase